MTTGAGLRACRKAGAGLEGLALAGVTVMIGFSLAAAAWGAEAGQADSPDLYSQSVTALLDRSFPSARVEYILLDLKTRRTVAVRWPHLEIPVPVGSLLKPFVALAYAGLVHPTNGDNFAAESSFPVVRCRGKLDGCWRAAGHGALALEQALAQSCNAYFLNLARAISKAPIDETNGISGVDQIDRVSNSYGLARPPARATPQTLIGVTPDWPVAPLALANAYGKLASLPQDPLVSRLLKGMRLAAGAHGTAARVGLHPGAVLAKTGTAPCRAILSEPARKPGEETACIASGDGLVVVLTPAEVPERLLLVRVRGTTGAQSAAVAGRILSLLEAVHAAPR